ncbi:TetR/AcrR family transcriptional regulator [Rhodoplanes roseus]|uniref:HTH tetR-type domain-containing protein n=1 Tax=Rhodoplanes roseus TaxID=29409 RepID=A0A327L2Z2_9BRAD|nr:TetR/AcrR family transcriptional regulator [Rhodoplanes roseus]RAI43862.1 hypothetical protein CH341_12090 [Rhodoplanes roseus]
MAKAQMRATILETASRLFASRGYAAVSMRDVATEVGVTPANLYYHFSDKEQLIREALVHVFTERTAPLETVLAVPVTCDQKLETFVLWLVGLLWQDEVFAKLLFRELLDGDRSRLEHLSRTVLERPFALITSATAGYNRRADPVLSAVSIIGIVLGHFQLSVALPFLPGGRKEHTDPEVVSRHILTVVRSAIAAPRLPEGA